MSPPKDYWLSRRFSVASSYLVNRAVWLATWNNRFHHSSKQTPRSKVLLKLGINMPTDLQIARQSCYRRLDRTRTTTNQLASLNNWLELFISLIWLRGNQLNDCFTDWQTACSSRDWMTEWLICCTAVMGKCFEPKLTQQNFEIRRFQSE
jgi:hypothetical protein